MVIVPIELPGASAIVDGRRRNRAVAAERADDRMIVCLPADLGAQQLSSEHPGHTAQIRLCRQALRRGLLNVPEN
jgi:hypothetical protein